MPSDAPKVTVTLPRHRIAEATERLLMALSEAQDQGGMRFPLLVDPSLVHTLVDQVALKAARRAIDRFYTETTTVGVVDIEIA